MMANRELIVKLVAPTGLLDISVKLHKRRGQICMVETILKNELVD